jgi:hypothetical protein
MKAKKGNIFARKCECCLCWTKTQVPECGGRSNQTTERRQGRSPEPFPYFDPAHRKEARNKCLLWLRGLSTSVRKNPKEVGKNT